jgi:hypothetical protein
VGAALVGLDEIADEAVEIGAAVVETGGETETGSGEEIGAAEVEEGVAGVSDPDPEPSGLPRPVPRSRFLPARTWRVPGPPRWMSPGRGTWFAAGKLPTVRAALRRALAELLGMMSRPAVMTVLSEAARFWR